MWTNLRRYKKLCKCECGGRLLYVTDGDNGFHTLRCAKCGKEYGGSISWDDPIYLYRNFVNDRSALKVDDRCLPCPFCGSRPVKSRWFGGKVSFDCPKCRIYTSFDGRLSIGGALNDWNHRVPREDFHGLKTCPWCGKAPHVSDILYATMGCDNPACPAHPRIAWRVVMESELTREDWFNLWNGDVYGK